MTQTSSNTLHKEYIGHKVLPTGYNESCLVLMVRDPECIYAYWDCNEKQFSAFVKNYFHKKSRWILCLNSTVKNDGMVLNRDVATEIPIDINSWNTYITLSKSSFEVLYLKAVLGIQTGKHIFKPFVWSNSISVPGTLQKATAFSSQDTIVASIAGTTVIDISLKPYSSACRME